MTQQELNTAQILLDQVKLQDHDRYRTIILANSVDRDRLMALAALNVEISQCLSNTNEPMLSQIKLQWWYDAITVALDGKVRKHPVLTELHKADAITKDILPLVTARQDELEREEKSTLQSTIDYASQTSGYLLQLMIASDCEALNEAADNIGTAWGLIGLLRGLLFHGAAQEDLIPEEVMETLKQEGEKTFSGNMKIVYETAATSILALIEEKLAAGRDSLQGQKLSSTDKGLFKLTILCDHYIQAIKKGQFDPALINFDQHQIKLLLKLMFRSY